MKYPRAQNFEDIILHRVFSDIEKGFYIDVGANDPILDSITYEFYSSGWRGINIEPVDEHYDKLCNERVHDVNLKVCAGSKDSENVTLLTVIGTGLSTKDHSIKDRVEGKGYSTNFVNFNSLTLNSIWNEYVQSDVHFLKIDVEGMEKEVLEGIELYKYRPWVILVEAVSPLDMEPNHHEWENMIVDQNYKYVYFDGLNRFYLAEEHSELKKKFLTPPNISDEMFHNVIRIRNQYPILISEKNRLETNSISTKNKLLIENQDLHVENRKTLNEMNQVLKEYLEFKKDIQAKDQYLQATIKTLEETAQNSQTVINNLTESNSELVINITHMNGVYDKLNNELLDKELVLNDIVGSKLWAATYPYRRVRDIIRNLSKRVTGQRIQQTVLYFKHYGFKQTLSKVHNSLTNKPAVVQYINNQKSEVSMLTKGEYEIFQSLTNSSIE